MPTRVVSTPKRLGALRVVVIIIINRLALKELIQNTQSAALLTLQSALAIIHTGDVYKEVVEESIQIIKRESLYIRQK